MTAQIRIITPYFHPEVISCVPLMTSLAEDLVAAGHQVEILTSAPVEWDDGTSVGRHADGARLPDSYRGARVVRLRNLFPRRPGAVSKLLEYAWFSLWIALRVLTGRRADAIYVYSNPPLMGLLVAVVAHLRASRVLYNLQDLFPDSAVSGGLLPSTSRALAPLRSLERLTYRTVDEVAAISDEFADHVKRVAPGARVRVIPNWIDTEEIQPVAWEENQFRSRVGLDDRFTVLYSGNLGYLHGIDTLIDAAVTLRNRDDIVFVIVGEGQRRDAMIERVRAERLDNVRFFDFQPFSLISHVYSAGDVCVVPMRRGAASTAIPSKTWSIMACARPVIAAMDPDSGLARLVGELGAGLVTEPEDGAALAAAVERLADGEVDGEEMGRRGREYVERSLSRRRITGTFVAALESLAGGKADAEVVAAPGRGPVSRPDAEVVSRPS